jgi:hypothetical protein
MQILTAKERPPLGAVYEVQMSVGAGGFSKGLDQVKEIK